MKVLENFNFEGQRVLLRVDFNVPLNDQNEITDDSRIQASMPTINYLRKHGARIIIMAHFGRPKGIVKPEFSLLPVYNYLKKHVDHTAVFIADFLSERAVVTTKGLKPGQIALLENLRFYPGEEAGDAEFASKLALLGDFYVNDAFGAAHRAHASTAVIAKNFVGSACYGKLMGAEVESLDRIFSSGEKPVTAIIGGAKVSSKIDILNNLISKVDKLIIGGGMAYTFIKAQGGKIGNSLVEEDRLELALEIIENAKKANVEVLLPIDSVNSLQFADIEPASVTSSSEVPDGQMGLDIGPKTEKTYAEAIKTSKTILWNGPLGVFEFSNYESGTKLCGEAIAEATKNGAFSLVGGGDSVAAVRKFGLEKAVSYVSTGGGAMLEYLEGKQLPGIAAIK
jgi:phosphoglycerate kinase